ncbi:unnamed protein product [Heligmosomoides polygyrus]|uniref:Phlebovirus_G2 domain-containing protein n=1 Tax=Heligmosomoides polygyrus TaxID=6339 RepID=A0A183GNA4_HELPZ|nr:unnamed protein product [Heligmosomoides polygyrus]
MVCEVVEDCKCVPAEVKMMCDCKDVNLTAHMLTMENRLPIIRLNLELRSRLDSVTSRILRSPTAEFILRIKNRFRTIALTSDSVCTVKSAHAIGCYKCAKGVRVNITCTSSTPQERAEIRCDEDGFTVPCSTHGTQSELRFTSNKARFYVNCSVQCVTSRSTFEIAGILRYTGSMQMAARRLLNGESEIFSEINLPGIGHVIDVFLRWSGNLFITVIVLIVALLTTYACVTNFTCIFVFKNFLRMILLMARSTFRIIRTLIWTPWKMLCHLMTNTAKSEVKLL